MGFLEANAGLKGKVAVGLGGILARLAPKGG